MRAIYKREFQSYFRSMTGNVFVALLVVFTGIYFMAYNLNMGYPYLDVYKRQVLGRLKKQKAID